METAILQGGAGGGGILTGACILIVEDQREVAALLEAAVTEVGGRVLAVAASVESAMTCIATETISAAIVTMIAGGIYTDAVAKELLRRAIPYVVTTGIGADRSHPELHAALTITKPFQAAYLQAVLADLVTQETASTANRP